MTASATVAQLIRTAQEGLQAGVWHLSDRDQLALDRLVAHLHWVDPAQPTAPTAVRLHDAAAEVAVAAVASEGELAWTLSQVTTELFSIVRTIDERNLPQLRQPTTAELSDAGIALQRLREFLLALRGTL
ncbi:hypothetical protein [Streptacidiphilus sp. BW17]|uniref:hypothetical protein n=1 Tax=Streptacidiphilus sp. BW17 TaxID=3156274 RepID=UPI003517A273